MTVHPKPDQPVFVSPEESLREYVLVSQTATVVERFTRAGKDWPYHAALGREAAVALESVGVTPRLADVYEGVEVPGDAADDDPGSGSGGGGVE